MPLDLSDEKSTLVQVMAWCHQATIKPLPEPILTQIYGVIRPQWVKHAKLVALVSQGARKKAGVWLHIRHQGPLLYYTWINFNPSMDK